MRLIDGDELLKHKTDHDMISTHLIYNAPTVDAVPMAWITDYEAKIVQNLAEIVQSKDFDDDEFHTQTCMLVAVVELQTAWAERRKNDKIN